MTARLAKIAVESFSAGQRDLYDAIAGGPRARGPQHFAVVDGEGRLEGPFNAMLLHPRLGSALQGLGSVIRYGSSLSDRARELAILAVAYAWDSAFERYAHEAVGRSVGLDQRDFDALRAARFEAFADPHERSVASTAYALATRRDLSDEEFAAAGAELGPALLFELSTLVGYYATLALQLRIFRVAAPVGTGDDPGSNASPGSAAGPGADGRPDQPRP